MGAGVALLMTTGLVGNASRTVLAIVGITIALAGLVFSSQTIEVTDTEVVTRLGFRVEAKRLKLSDITRVENMPSRWYEGWGIHLTPRGWLYNVSGFGAVEFTLRNRTRVRFGTDDAANLIAAVQRAMPVPRETAAAS
jgi:hypothetical protein